MKPSDYIGMGVSIAGAGAALCGLKWAGWSFLADAPYWLLAGLPAIAIALESVVWFVERPKKVSR